MKKLFVRIGQKAGPEKFYRCGIEFSRAWQLVEVDAATASRLEAEQMLEASEDQPEDYTEPVDDDADAKAVIESARVEAAGKAKAAAQAKKK